MVFPLRAPRGPLFLLWLGLVVASPVPAAPLTLADAERLALERDAGAAAYDAEAEVYSERAVAARQLPNPEARVGVVNVPVDSFSLGEEEMSMVEVGVMQKFTWDRAAQGRRLDALSEGQRAQAAMRRRQVLKDVRVAWFEAAATRRTAEKVAEQRRWLEQMSAASRSMYASGEGGQVAILGARLERAMLEEKALELRQMTNERRAALARWLGPDADAQLELPRPAPPAPLAALEAKLAAHPTHAGFEAQAAAAQAEAAMAQAMSKPMLAFDVGYGFRQGAGMEGEPRPDMLTAMVTFELPIFPRNRQRRELAAARSMERSAELMAEDNRRMLQMSLREVHAKATLAHEMLVLLEQTVLPTARAAAEAALAGYRAGEESIDPVIAAARARLDAEIRHVRAQADVAVASAEIAALVGDEQ
jgi:outer membrane protein TolC